jgi:cytidylate kinase
LKNIIIAIDGYSSCGKSTLAKQLASYLNFRYVDTGAMYRAVALFALKNNLIDENAHVNVVDLIKRLDQIHIDFRYNPERKASDTFLNNENVETEIRGMRVSNIVSKISIIKQVRQAMIALQQNMGKDKAIVMDGRDIGTAVFPNAELKLFMTADPDIRVKRRLAELEAKGDKVSYDEVKQNLLSRDFDDVNRAENPLIQAKDAIIIDNSFLTKEEQFQQVLLLLEKI